MKDSERQGNYEDKFIKVPNKANDDTYNTEHTDNEDVGFDYSQLEISPDENDGDPGGMSGEQHGRTDGSAQKKRSEEIRKSEAKEVFSWVKVIIAAVIVALVINFFVIINSTVPTGSMENTIMAGSRMVGYRLAYVFGEPQRGDIIIFKYPDDTSQDFVKRVIGLPGETVSITAGKVYINGKLLEEDYLKETPDAEDFGPYVVPEDSYFCMGDNRNNSKDSRYWVNTYVPKSYILGKAIFVYWPFSNIGLLK